MGTLRSVPVSASDSVCDLKQVFMGLPTVQSKVTAALVDIPILALPVLARLKRAD